METVLRVAAIYVFVLVSMRLLGKRELGELSPFELVLLMLIPDIAQQGMVREDYSLTNALIGLGTLFSLAFLNGVLTYLFKPIEKLVEGTPSVIFHRGRFRTDSMDRERVTVEEVFSAMHRSGLERLEQIKMIVLEPDGEITFIPRRTAEHGPARSKRKSPAA